MTARRWLAGAAALALAGIGALALSDRTDEVPAAPAHTDRPTLLLLTSLPLVFGESFGLEGGGSPALARLEQRYTVKPIGVADAASLNGQALLLMAHPRAQPAEALVYLDQWVRDGGHLLLLADPRLDWPSERPPGDVLRAPPMFADTGLLAHWGLRLSPPVSIESNGRCQVDDGGLVARCRIGRGQVTVIADADFLNVENAGDKRLDPLITELDRLGTR